jgi:glutaredoxin 3
MPTDTAAPKVTIYTRPFCGYCSRALSLLNERGIDYTEIEAGFDQQQRREMVRRSGRNTFPQIFVGDAHVGGCDELMALDRAGRFDAVMRP